MGHVQGRRPKKCQKPNTNNASLRASLFRGEERIVIHAVPSCSMHAGFLEADQIVVALVDP
jgi:hypothetical protein